MLSVIPAELFSLYTPDSLSLCISHLYVCTHHLCTQFSGFSSLRLGVDGTSGVERGVLCCFNNHPVAFLLDTDEKHLFHQNTPLVSCISKQNLLSAVDFTLEVLLRDE